MWEVLAISSKKIKEMKYEVIINFRKNKTFYKNLITWLNINAWSQKRNTEYWLNKTFWCNYTGRVVGGVGEG